jgi:hypothetical protein
MQTKPIDGVTKYEWHTPALGKRGSVGGAAPCAGGLRGVPPALLSPFWGVGSGGPTTHLRLKETNHV